MEGRPRPCARAEPCSEPEEAVTPAGEAEMNRWGLSASDQVRACVVYCGSEVEPLARQHERVDPEDLSVAVDQWAARVAWVQCLDPAGGTDDLRFPQLLEGLPLDQADPLP
jgi:hypothetical protein